MTRVRAPGGTRPDPSPAKRIWAQDVHVNAEVMESRLAMLRLRAAGQPHEAELAVIADGVARRLTAAKAAALRRDPIPGRVSNWWRGTLVEASYQNLHAAESLVVGLYDEAELDAEIPEAVARVEGRLQRDDPRRLATMQLLVLAPGDHRRRERLRKAIEVGFGAADAEHSRLRSFRNAVMASAGALLLALIAFVLYVASRPAEIPFCFALDQRPAICPSGSPAPSAADVLCVVLMGVLGGLLSAIVSIKNLHGTSVPYNVPHALAMLKVPLGALSAITGLLIIRGEFVPGLSELDSQPQILAYALVFGGAQQLVIGLLDKQAQRLMDAAPGKGAVTTLPERVPPPSAPGSPSAPGPPEVPPGSLGEAG